MSYNNKAKHKVSGFWMIQHIPIGKITKLKFSTLLMILVYCLLKIQNNSSNPEGGWAISEALCPQELRIGFIQYDDNFNGQLFNLQVNL